MTKARSSDDRSIDRHLGQQMAASDPYYIKGTTMTFAGIVVAQMGNVLACRTNKTSIFRTGLKSNKWIWVGIASQVTILSLIIYVPFLQTVFGTGAIGLADWGYLALLAVIVVSVEEVRKWFSRRWTKNGKHLDET